MKRLDEVKEKDGAALSQQNPLPATRSRFSSRRPLAQGVPYLGYTEIEVTLSKRTAGVSMKTTVLALVRPVGVNDNTPLLLGTNASAVRSLTTTWKDLSRRQRRRRSQTKAWANAVKVCSRKEKIDKATSLGPVRLASPSVLRKYSSLQVEVIVNNSLGRAVDALVFSAWDDLPAYACHPPSLNMQSNN